MGPRMREDNRRGRVPTPSSRGDGGWRMEVSGGVGEFWSRGWMVRKLGGSVALRQKLRRLRQGRAGRERGVRQGRCGLGQRCTDRRVGTCCRGNRARWLGPRPAAKPPACERRGWAVFRAFPCCQCLSLPERCWRWLDCISIPRVELHHKAKAISCLAAVT